MKPLFLYLFLIGILLSINVLAQDSLAQYSLAELDTLHKYTKTPQQKRSYALAMLKKGKQELDT